MRLFLLDAAGSLVFFALGYYWLGLNSATNASLALSVAVLIALALLGAWLMSFAFSRDVRSALRRVPVLLPWLVIAAAVAGLYFYAASYAEPLDHWVSSALTLATRTPVQLPFARPLIGFLAFLIAATVLLPAAARAVQTGSLRDWRPVFTRPHLAAAVVYLYFGLWLPWTLFWWIPETGSFAGEMTSFLVRAGLALFFFVGAWLVFAWHCRAESLAPER